MKKFLLLAISLSLVSCAELNSVLDSVNKGIGGVSNQSSAGYQSISPQKICKDFKDNEILAERTWTGAYVSIKGKIISIEKNDWGEPQVYLEPNSRIRVSAVLKNGDLANKLKAGNFVNAKGAIRGIVKTGLACHIQLENVSL